MTEQRQGPDHAALLKRSLVAIDQLKDKLAAAERARSEPIAIIGIGCRFPGGVDSPEAFWELLHSGRDAVTEVPPQRWDVERYYDPNPDAVGKSYTRWGSFVDDVDRFDAPFFGISPREAVSMDPQQRLLLEVSWEALERAGVAPSSLAGSRTAVYIGITTGDYSGLMNEARGLGNGDAYTPSGTAHSVAAGRLSYFLGLHGPNVAIDTACSSSLVALHWGIQSLRNGEADLALAGGVNLTLSHDGAVLTSRARMMSFDGHCKTFDASADGYVRGEGCGILVLKRLSDAQRDGDRVLAVLRGSALNQDGRSSGLTAPNGAAQEAVIRAALANARLQPGDIGYVEAHGTGTPLGDPIEVKALNQVFGERPKEAPLLVGSVKTNIGHLEAAAGVAGVIKVVLAMQHATIPPHLHLRKPNQLIAWDQYPIQVPTQPTVWRPMGDAPLRASVSSFGFSGTNAHMVIEQATAPAVPAAPAQDASARAEQLFVLSANTPAALALQARRLSAALAARPDQPLGAVAATLALGRSHFVERLGVVAATVAELRGQLDAFADSASASDAESVAPAGVVRARASLGAAPEVVFMFTGQGAQYAGMGRQLYEQEPVFRAAMDECDRLVSPLLPHGLLETIFAQGADAARLDDTAFTQPALFAIEYSLAMLWRAWGVVPTAVLGHSVGEYVAACLAGVFSLEDGLRLIAERGRLMGRLPREGGMAAVFADEATVRAAIGADAGVLSIAAVNGPQNTVLSGRRDALQAALARLTAQGVESQPLVVSHAFHSPLMEPMLDEFRAVVASVHLSPPNIELASNLTGTLAGDEVCTPDYWCRHIRDAVRFHDGIAALHKAGYRVFLEVGPAPTLMNMAQRASGGSDSSWIGSLRKGRGDTRCLLESLGRLHARGLPVHWPAVLGEAQARQRADLPTYPFQRERYWFEDTGRPGGAALAPTRSGHPLLGGVVASPLAIFQSEIGVAGHPWLADHRIFEFTLFPGTGFLELALAAAREASGSAQGELRDVVIREGLPLPDEGQRTVQVIVEPRDEGLYGVKVFSRAPAEDGQTSSEWKLHVSAGYASAPVAAPVPVKRAGLLGAAAREHEVAAYYAQLAAQGAHYGPAFRCITEIRGEGSQVLGRVALPVAVAPGASGFLVHPALLDACLQLVGVGLPWGEAAADGTPSDDLCVPVGMGRLVVHQPGLTQAWCHVSVQGAEADADVVRGDVTLFDDHGAVVAELRALELRRVTRAALQRAMAGATPPAEWAFEAAWQVSAPAAAADAVAPGRWLVLGDDSGVGEALAARLRQAGAGVALIRRGDRFDEAGPGGWRVDPGDAAQVRRAIGAAAAADARALQGVVVAWSLAPADSGTALQDAHLARLGDLLRVVQALGDAPGARLWWLTRGAQSVAGSRPDLVQAPLWGLGGVVASEYPAMRPVRIDLDPAHRDDETELLFQAVWCGDAEDRVALREGARFVSRLVPGDFVPEPRPLQLDIRQRGSLDQLALVEVPREAPGPGQVEIRVHATGLNFRDVLNALGMYPGDPGPLGNECSGVISAVGEGVTDLAVGDEVVAMIDRSFATWVIAPAVMTVLKPPGMTFAEAATIPVTFLTAEYALRHLAGMKQGDRVLVHAVTGGVGMAALQLARRAGAEVFGTAGSPAKRTLARELGAHHLADSRSLSFAADVMRDSNGQGVDIVLNSLAGDFIPESLRMLRSGGHFIEIGKTGIWDKAKVAEEFPGVHYHPLYLGEVAAARPEFVRDMLRDLLADFERGVLKPLPQRLYPIERAEDAFRYMGQGHHVGKIVITQHHAPRVRADASYLITGGLTGLGLVTARWLAEEGARQLVLVGRRAPSAEAEVAIDTLRAMGVQVRVAQTDVADAAQVHALVDSLDGRGDMARLRGVVHAAGVIDDATLAELDPARFAPVLAPKVQGSWNLHQATAGLALDFFVCFSSGAALMGSPGQGNYAAANSFMDALAQERAATGQHALSINWGSWAEVGMAAGLGETHHRRWAAMGLGMITPEDGMRMLARMLSGARSPQMAAMPMVRSRLPTTLGTFFSALVGAAPAKAASSGGAEAVDILPRLASTPAAERHAVLSAFLCDQIVRVLALGAAHQPDPQRSLIDLGMDSLMAMELRNRIQASLKATVAVADLLQGPSVATLTTTLLDSISLPADETPRGHAADQGVEWEEGTL